MKPGHDINPRVWSAFQSPPPIEEMQVAMRHLQHCKMCAQAWDAFWKVYQSKAAE